jgi:integrase
MGRRKCKGEVSIQDDKGHIRLRWRFNSERYSLNLGLPYKRSYLVDAKNIAECIENDINSKEFDSSLLKYKNFKVTDTRRFAITPNTESDSKILSNAKHNLSTQKMVSSTIKVENNGAEKKEEINLPKQFERWTAEYRNRSCKEDVDYNLLKKMLARWDISYVEDVVTKLQTEKFSVSTYNRRLTLLKEYFNWLFKKKHIVENPLDDVCRKRSKKKEIAAHKPFTLEETSGV